jgi:hypothetical protein
MDTNSFCIYLNVLKQTFCAHYKVGGCGKFMFNTLLLAQTLDLQTSFSRWPQFMTSFKLVLWKENDLNLILWLWCKVFVFTILKHKLFEYIKLVKIVSIQVLESIQDEWTIKIVNFMNRKL